MLDHVSPMMSPARLRHAPAMPDEVRGFLIKSNRRIVGHCQTLLAAADLPDEQRQRLAALLASATDQLHQAERHEKF